MSRPLVLLDADVVGRQRTGDERYTLGLLRELPGAAPDLRLACTLREPEALGREVPATLTRIRLAVGSPYLRIPVAFPHAARRVGAGLVHVHYFVPPRLPCPAVATVHDLSFERAPELLARRDRLLFQRFVPGSLRRARRVIAVSEFTRVELLDRYGLDPERVVAIPNGVGPEFSPVPDAEALAEARHGLDGPYVLYVGALAPRKNVGALVDAYARLVDEGLPHLLAVAGGDRGAGAQVRARVDAHGLAARVRFLGHVPEPDLPALYSGAAALCLPSLYEGFGLPALEAMACGTPVAASGGTGLAEAVGPAGLTFDPSSPGRIADALAVLLTDEDLRARLVEDGLGRAAAFTWRRAAEATAEVYREALA